MSSNASPRADEQFCSTCGSIIKERAEICPECGVKNTAQSGANEPAFQFCESCGEEIRSDTELCPSCGVTQTSAGTDGLDSSDVILYVLGSLFIIGGLGTLLDPEGGLVASILTGLVLTVAGIAMLPVVHQRSNRRYSLTTFGTVRSVNEYPVSNDAEACTVCQRPVTGGVRREYTEEFTLFGVVLSSDTGGMNTYCESCAGTRTGPHAQGTVDSTEPTTPSGQYTEQTAKSQLDAENREE